MYERERERERDRRTHHEFKLNRQADRHTLHRREADVLGGELLRPHGRGSRWHHGRRLRCDVQWVRLAAVERHLGCLGVGGLEVFWGTNNSFV